MTIAVLVCIILGFLIRAYVMRDVSFFDWDEGIYAEVASELIDFGGLQTTFNGQVWFNKPPLSHYLISGMMRIIPDPELAARLVMAVFGSLLVILTYFLARKLINKLFKSELKALPKIEQSLVPLIPVLALASAPIIVERAVQLNTDVMLGVLWLTYFLYIENYWIKLLSIIVGVWTKSLLGLYPLGFEVLMLKKKPFSLTGIVRGAGYLLLPLTWHVANYINYGDYFIESHLMDQLVKRVTDPIELHYGGRLFYFELAWESFNVLFLIMIFGYAWYMFELLHVRDTIFDVKKYHARIMQLWRSNKWPYYLTIFSAVPFFIFLTFVQSKITWYFATVAPLFTLILPYVYIKLPKIGRYALLAVVTGFFLYNFIPQTYALKVNTDGTPSNVRVSQCITRELPESDSISMLVNAQERQNRNVLEAAQQQTETSFIYGGSPSFVYYARRPVYYYYKPEEFISDIEDHSVMVVSQDDIDSGVLASVSAQLDAAQSFDVCSYDEWRVIVQ